MLCGGVCFQMTQIHRENDNSAGQAIDFDRHDLLPVSSFPPFFGRRIMPFLNAQFNGLIVDDESFRFPTHDAHDDCVPRQRPA
jgi:hypothetical protein